MNKTDFLHPILTADSHQVSTPWVNQPGLFGWAVQFRVTISPNAIKIEEVARLKLVALWQDFNTFFLTSLGYEKPNYTVKIINSFQSPTQKLTQDQEKKVIDIIQDKTTIESLETQDVTNWNCFKNFMDITNQIRPLLDEPEPKELTIEQEKQFAIQLENLKNLLKEDELMTEKANLIKTQLPNELKSDDNQWLERKKEIQNLAKEYYENFSNAFDILKEIDRVLDDKNFLKNPTLYLDKIERMDAEDDFFESNEKFDRPQNAVKEFLNRFFPRKNAF